MSFERGNLQLVHGDRERTHGIIGEVDGGPAPVVDIPGHGARVLLVVVVGAHLAVDADDIHDAHSQAEEDAYDGRPDAHDEADKFGEEDEER